MAGTLRVQYDTSLELVTVRPGIWSAAMPAKWFENYRIISTIDNPLSDIVKTIDLRHYYRVGEQLNRKVSAIYRSDALKRLIAANHLEEYRHVVSQGAAHNATGYKLLGDFHDVARSFENKANVRRWFEGAIAFPPYRFLDAHPQQPDTYERLSADLGTTHLVLQRPEGSGSRGTLFANDQKEFLDALMQLKAITAPDEQLVVSRRIENALERSVQVCVTDAKIYVGPAQAQLVRHPLLTSNKQDSVKFCGGRIAPGLMSETAYGHARQAAILVAKRLRENGYRGIFGIDFLIAPGDVLYMLEVNARTTGLTPLLGSVQETVPYQLLHLLELARESYDVDDVVESYNSGSFVEVYAQAGGSLHMQTGRYSSDGTRLGDGFETTSLLPEDKDEYFIALRVSPGEVVEDGKAIAYVYSKAQLFDDIGKLDERLETLLEIIRSRFVAMA